MPDLPEEPRRAQWLSLADPTRANDHDSTASLSSSGPKKSKPLKDEDDSTKESPMPKKRAKLTKHNSADDTTAAPGCCICMSSIARRELSGIDCCSHEFCFDCIAEWSNTQNQCPLCKYRFARISRVHPARKCNSSGPSVNVMDVPERNRLQRGTASSLSISFAFPFETLDRDSLALAFHMFRQLAPSMGISQDAQDRTIQRFQDSHNNATREQNLPSNFT